MDCFGPEYCVVRVAVGVGRHLGARTSGSCRVPRGARSSARAGDQGPHSLQERSRAALRVGGKVYAVRDRIQIAGHRGVVLDHDIFATKLLEIGPGQASHLYTGRVTVFPNSLLFSNALIKENPGQEYGLYILVIPLREQDDWRDAERHLLDAAKAECSSFMEEAGRHMKLLEQTNLLEAPSPEPRITVQLADPGHIQLVLRFPAPDRGRSRIEQSILRRYLTAATVPSTN
jgi:small-conductance mechanosensitive channel